MKSNKELKALARAELKQNWNVFILLNLIPVLISASISIVAMITTTSGVSTVINRNGNPILIQLEQLISAVFIAGISWTLLGYIRKEQTQINPLQDSTVAFRDGNLISVAALIIVQRIFIFLWTLLLIVPGLIKIYSYSQSYFIYYDQKNKQEQKPSISECISDSQLLMKGHKKQLFWLDISFLGWHILSVLSFGLGYLLLRPYISLTKTMFYDELVKQAEGF